ncbi:MAG: N-acetylglucosamine kinase [Bacteroidia bacterium]|nr:N-acetylglucosamine kinase [Bacteroidia bacterium]MCF8425568.1 N-acetylglucosamine kinase [Bacteroidia bacterium]
MYLIADSGSTKTDWCLTNKSGTEQKIFHTIGYNPYFIDTEAIYYSLSENLLKDFDGDVVTEIYFYGAGCSTPEKKEIVRKALVRSFPKANSIFVGHDLLATARALLGKEKGFAAILGTGCNTCLYDGEDVSMNIDSLGYLLGDEGSGSYIGKKIVRDFMRGRLEPPLQARFQERFQIVDNEQIFHTLYTTQFPNRYLASFCKFADEFVTHPYIRNKVRDSFRDFFKNLASKYPDYKDYKFNCIGSVGFVFKDILEEVALSYDMHMGRVIKSPLEDLVKFHLEEK